MAYHLSEATMTAVEQQVWNGVLDGLTKTLLLYVKYLIFKLLNINEFGKFSINLTMDIKGESWLGASQNRNLRSVNDPWTNNIVAYLLSQIFK
jgi:hypothetical protein